MKKFEIEIKWAILLTLAAVVWHYIEKQLGWHDKHINMQPIYTMLFIFVTITVFILALKEKKKMYYNNLIDWKQGFLSGSILSLFVAMLSPVVLYLFVTVISPNFIETALANAISKSRAPLEQLESYYNINSYIYQNVFSSLSLGIVISACVAYFIKTKENEKTK